LSNPFQAIAYLKAEAPAGDPQSTLELDEDDSPVLKKLETGLLVAYLVDLGESFTYVQGRDLKTAGIDAAQLHAHALANLEEAADGKVTIRQNGPIWALFFDGNFEASLILLDNLWEDVLGEYHGGTPAIAVPARDVLCFCNASSTAGIAELRDVIRRVWPRGDHLLSDQIFERRGRRWVARDLAS
jgi:uncharacterized protein YtpQ (UPF0354 family)